MTAKEIKQRLHELQDKKYRDFQRRLIPNIPPESIIGVRTPELRKLAKEIGEDSSFLDTLPHEYFEENQLHAFIISGMRDFGECVSRLEKFLPYVDNWATCDQLSPGVFAKNHERLAADAYRWTEAEHTYTVRFGIGALMAHFLDGDFKPEYLRRVAEIRSEEYYIRMMQAWYFATALAKQREAALPYFSGGLRDEWVRKKAICKAIESRRVDDATKELLRGMR